MYFRELFGRQNETNQLIKMKYFSVIKPMLYFSITIQYITTPMHYYIRAQSFTDTNIIKVIHFLNFFYFLFFSFLLYKHPLS